MTAGLEPGEAQRAALSKLCQIYWFPLYVYVRGRGHSVPDAQDLTQGFFERLLEKEKTNRMLQALDLFERAVKSSDKNPIAASGLVRVRHRLSVDAP